MSRRCSCKPESQVSEPLTSITFARASGFCKRQFRGKWRCGFSLIELITAMLASTVLVATLAATVSVSTKLMEVPPGDKELWHDREIADRLASDLRYATDINDPVGYGFEITRPDPASGSPQTAIYESYTDGLTRRVASGPMMNLDPDAPAHQFLVDGYSAPTLTASSAYARLRSSSTATTTTARASLDIDVPPSCKPGDLVLLCISSKTPSSMSLSDAGWQTLQVLNSGNLVLVVASKTYDATWSPATTISLWPDSATAAAMVAIENVDSSSPINWTGSDSGYAWWNQWWTHPRPLETAGFTPRQLNVQIYAAEYDPWSDGALGMAGFTDAAQATAAQGIFSLRNSIGIAIRNDATPSLATTSRLYHQVSGTWLQAAVRLEALP